MGALQTMEEINAKISELEAKVISLEKRLEENTVTTNTIARDTKELLALFHTLTTALQIGTRLTLGIGRWMQWMAGLIIAGGVLYTFYHDVRIAASIPFSKP